MARNSDEIVKIKASNLSIDPLTERKPYDKEVFRRLVKEIEIEGFRPDKALRVRPNPNFRGKYLITCGQHRYRAGLEAGVAVFPCKIERTQEDRFALRGAYFDNELSCPVDAITEAEYFKKMAEIIQKGRGKKFDELKRKMPLKELALEFSHDENYVKSRLRLLQLPKAIQFMVRRYAYKYQRGYKMSPTVAEKFFFLYNMLKAQNVKNPESELVKTALIVSDKGMSKRDVYSMLVEISTKGYDAWKNRKVSVTDAKYCTFCGRQTSVDDGASWIIPCPDCRSKIEVLMREGKIPHTREFESKKNPNIPLHEQNSELHKPKMEHED